MSRIVVALLEMYVLMRFDVVFGLTREV